ncbi:MAG: SPASM domain-containing protein [Bacteroidales bacterium]|nr:SPASM domain-containing protein [Bacteroidales bacterium]
MNALSAGYSFLVSSLTGRSVISGMPVSVSAELTNFCNLNCPECNSGSGVMTRSRGYMDIDLFSKLMEEISPFLFNMNLYFQGEPMMHPKFFTFLRKCREINTTVSTNGHFLSEENAEKLVKSGLKKIIVSLDGFDQDTYSLYRKNGDINKVLEGIKNISEAKKRNSSSMKLVILFLVNSNNEHQIKDIRHYAGRMNASLNLKSMQIINKDKIGFWLPAIRKYGRYEKDGNGYRIKNRFPNMCARLWFNPVISWDGKVLPCCFDKDAEHVMGDLNEDSFSDIWNGPRYRIFRKSILSDRKMTEICRNCTSGMRL